MITFADNSMVADLKALWKVVFGDSDEYIDLYFRYRFEPKNTMVYLDEGKPIGMIAMLPLEIRTPFKDLFARYIYAVATHPDYRGKGISTLIMEQLDNWCKGHDVDLSILVPAEKSLFNFYNDRGYNINFNIRTLTKTSDEIEAIASDKASAIQLKKTTVFNEQAQRNRYFNRSHMYAKWDERALKYQDLETTLTGGEVISFGEKIGYAICYRINDTIFIKELVFFDISLDEALIALHSYYKAQSYILRLWEDTINYGEVIPFAMIKWYDVKRQKLLEDEGGKAPYIGLVLD